MYCKLPLLSKFLRNFVEIVDILEYNWIKKGLFKLPNGISSRLSTNCEMPTNCCVPLCTKKDKRDKETGEKISFFRFPEDEDLMKQWIHAIRRDVGPYFSVNEGTRVCLRHFKTEDLHKSLNGRVSPRPGAVPSIFAWKRSLPRKRPPPTPRLMATTVAKNLTSQDSEAMDLAAKSPEIATSTNMVEFAFPETA